MKQYPAIPTVGDAPDELLEGGHLWIQELLDGEAAPESVESDPDQDESGEDGGSDGDAVEDESAEDTGGSDGDAVESVEDGADGKDS